MIYIFRGKIPSLRDIYYVPQAVKQSSCKLYFGTYFHVIIWFKDFWTHKVTWFSLCHGCILLFASWCVNLVKNNCHHRELSYVQNERHHSVEHVMAISELTDEKP